MAEQSDKLRIVVADDHPSIRVNLIYLLDAEPDMTVVGAARNGQEAFARVLELRPDVVVLDHDMPGLTGLDVLRRLRRERIGTRVVLYTLTDEACAEARSLGATACVGKDEPYERIVDAVRATGGFMLRRPAAEALRDRQMPAISPLRVVVAEDDEGTRHALVEALQHARHEVVAVGDGEEALRECARRDPDVILVDLLMPKIGGRDFIRAYRRNPEARARIITLSALAQARQIAAELGCDAGFAKPFDLGEVLAAVEGSGGNPPRTAA